MSETKMISPILDDFVMGEAFSEHHGVRCYPAMPKDSDQKYIIKIISIPASQVQMEALLLTGAYPNKEAALAYFKELSDDTAGEAEILEKLSKFEGFLPYEEHQIEPMEDGSGYQIYLKSTYKRSLERYLRKHSMTHLAAVNLGLDLCAAMAVCRRAGYLYVDLKPSNVFISEKQEYRVGDLGFIPMESLKYASLPDKYRSSYTAPEAYDTFAYLNDTVDVYAIGMILYQVYNGGKLPFEGKAPANLEPPIYADYEMAEIILKACASDPRERWQDPIQMGQAIVSYMQRNGANDVPIVPLPPTPEKNADEAETSAEQTQNEQAPATEAEPANAGEFAFMDQLVSDETAPDENSAADIEYDELSEETSDILSQADELIAHETPEPVIAPEPIDVSIPEPVKPETDEPEQQEEAAPVADASEESDVQENEEVPAEPAGDIQESEEDEGDIIIYDYPDPAQQAAKRKRFATWIGLLSIILAILISILGGLHFYNNYYLQNIESIAVNGAEDWLIVNLTTDVDNRLLTVVISDTHGTSTKMPVINNRSEFKKLNSNTKYTVTVEISGFHKLTGSTSHQYSTPAQTSIVNFNAVTGQEDGSVILSFTPDGYDNDTWTVEYAATGEEAKQVTFSGHMTTITGLTVGKTYTFKLSGPDDLYITGTNTLEHTASALIYAQKVQITGCSNKTLTVQWEAPEEVTVEKWRIRCYNDSGYDETLETTGTTIEFADIDTASGYTIEVTADGMSVNTRAYVTPNALTITNFNAVVTENGELSLSWETEGEIPAAGLILMYTVDNGTQKERLELTGNSATIPVAVPGATYHFTFNPADGASIFGGTYEFEVPVTSFVGCGGSADRMSFRMCRTPGFSDWKHYDVPEHDYTTVFKVGEKASFSVYMSGYYNIDHSPITTMFVIRDAEGNIVSTDSVTDTWYNMWLGGYCELDIPSLPDIPGEYTVEMFFNRMHIGEGAFTIQAA